MIRKSLFLVLIATMFLMTACAGPGTKQVKVAVSLPLGLGIGEEILDAVQLALEEENSRAGDIDVELLILNTSDPEGSPVSPELEQEAAQQAIDDPQVVAYIGPLASDQAKVSIPMLNEAGIALISPAATWPGLTKPGYEPGEPGIYYPTGRRNFFRVVPSDDVQGAAAARWADQLLTQTTYIVDEGTAYGQGVAGIFKISAEDLGIEILGHESFDSGAITDEEIEAVAAKVVEREPDLLYYGGSYATATVGATGSVGGKLVSMVKKMNPKIRIMGPDALVQDQLIEEFGADLVEGILGTNVAVPPTELESASEFVASYRARFDKAPPPYAGGAYDAMKVILVAIEQAEEPSREGVLTALKNLGRYQGVLGEWQFNSHGDISLRTISGMRIRNGEWAFVEIID
jgi:branched-chain amino acid transport system substrate-binding protein